MHPAARFMWEIALQRARLAGHLIVETPRGKAIVVFRRTW